MDGTRMEQRSMLVFGGKTCTCYEFQALMIPCTHAIAAATRYRIPVELRSGPDTHLSVNPPASRRPPGRPRKNRYLSRGEFQVPKERQSVAVANVRDITEQLAKRQYEGVYVK
ncbi:LOW QUALITY PROTEIN: hypothetical protein HID58_040977 [Brassica napus]|uniref:SWIM-type domain-containing protein n=1 Tax=Brassica napus TaxID=3708 RepID=A0ABQ8B9J8_BRANA|nr:LOW QUALITY PROTEIN: hypothetical protein HID58_040977 [Brassica napus]